MHAFAISAALALVLAAPPTITLNAPVAGWSTQRIINVTGKVTGVQEATLVINGSERPLQLTGDGSFNAVFLPSPGANLVAVLAKNNEGRAEKRTTFYSLVPKLDLVVMLYWDTGGTDVDLHVTDPSNEECFYGHRQTKAGGKLDVDDTDGFGPEVFTLADAPDGDYKVSVAYYSDNGHPQSLAVVDVVQYPGTDREEHVFFEKMLTRTGDTVEVGTFKLANTGEVGLQ
jgi:uncharacterized protein YfaP (DUF2135 family)